MKTALKNLVCSVEESKKLNELGVRQQSRFYWTPEDDGNLIRYSRPAALSAFTASELENMLPKTIEYKARDQIGGEWRHHVFSSGRNLDTDEWYVMYSDPNYPDKPHLCIIYSETEVTTLVKMIVYLIENEFVTA